MQIVPVALHEHSYDICIGRGLLERCGELIAQRLHPSQVILITDTQVGPLHAHTVQTSLTRSGMPCQVITIPAGESSKSFSQLDTLIQRILDYKPDRTSVLVALGGGVVGDLTGFAASIILRGIDFVQIPTSLLAQVDSSVGGKTGINTVHGKNLVGSFHQPRLVVTDIDVLDTLPLRQMQAGYAEIVKYGMIEDAAFFAWCEQYGHAVVGGDKDALAYAIKLSCEGKARIVADDEKERDRRALLNLGHTFGHALEAETGYSDQLLHGEAVAIGLVMAAAFSAQCGLCDTAIAPRITAHLRSVGLPVAAQDIRPHWDAHALVSHMYQDKKAQAGTLTFVLLRAIGEACVQKMVNESILLEYLQRVLNTTAEA